MHFLVKDLVFITFFKTKIEPYKAVTEGVLGGARTSKGSSILPEPLLGSCNIHRKKVVEGEALNFISLAEIDHVPFAGRYTDKDKEADCRSCY